MPGDLDDVRGLADEDANSWPSQERRSEKILNELVKGKMWVAWDGTTAAGTITVDTEEPFDVNARPLWPDDQRRKPAPYLRRIIVSRRYAGLRLGAALLDWAADMAGRDHHVALIRADVWTTNTRLHAYFERQRFRRLAGRDPRELTGYPSRVLFEHKTEWSGRIIGNCSRRTS